MTTISPSPAPAAEPAPPGRTGEEAAKPALPQPPTDAHRDEPAGKSPPAAGGDSAQGEGRRARRVSIALVILTTLAIAYSVYFARAVLMPAAMALVLALLLRPAVRRARRWRISDGVSAAVLLLLLMSVGFLGLINLMEPARDWIDSAPQRLEKAGEKLHVIRRQINEISEASEKVEQIATGKADKAEPIPPFPFAADEDPAAAAEANRPSATPGSPASSGRSGGTAGISVGSADSEVPAPAQPLAETDPEKPVPVEVKQPRLVAGMSYISSTGSLLSEIFVTLVLAYFLLATGDVLINNVLHILPTMREKRSVVELIYSVERGISSYLLTMAAINLCLGVAIALAMWLLGLPNPVLWGAMATLFNFVPYIGALVGVGVIAVVSVLTFDSLAYAAAPPFVYWLLTALEGNFVTPHLLGRSMSLNPVVVFLSLVFWGWLWGVGGALLAVPLLAIAKVSLDQFERTRPIGTLLGGGLRS